MKKDSLYWISVISLILSLVLNNICSAQEKIIFDTDIGPDWDDVGATAVLHALADSGEAEILAMMVSSGGYSATWGPPCLDAFNTFYDRPEIPIGVGIGGPDMGSAYNRQIAEEFPQDLGTENAWDAVELYRKILSEEPDSSVVIVTVGFITNLEDLLKSEADSYSSLNGIELVEQKVKHWICMGGGFPSSGGEFNFNRDPSATKFTVENWPKPALFSGYEIGAPIQTGAKLALTSETNPIRRAYELAGGYVGATRSSWDQTAVLAAIRDPLLFWDLETTGYCSVGENGSNVWLSSPDKDHSYLIKKLSNEEMVEIIDNLMADLEGMPTVKVITPSEGASFDLATEITIEAEASDENGQVVKVEFFVQGTKIGEDNAAPYSITWSSSVNGGYRLSAKVFDDEGNSKLSEQVKIFVGDVDMNLVGHWMFENNVADSSDHGNDGIISGSPEFVTGKMDGTALHFKTNQDYVSIGTSPDFSMESFTLAAWVKIPQSIPSGWRAIIEHDRWSSNWFGLWKSSNANKFHFRWSNGAKSTSDFSSEISADTWYHVAGTYDASEQIARMYLNGEIDQRVTNADIPVPSNAEIRVGLNLENNEEFKGIIDDLRIYNKVLNQTEIENLVNVTSIGDQLPIVREQLPHVYNLSNYPNPFNPFTQINFTIPVASKVKIEVYDIAGHKIRTLLDSKKEAGAYAIPFDGHNLSSGIYFYRFQSDYFETTKKMILVK